MNPTARSINILSSYTRPVGPQGLRGQEITRIQKTFHKFDLDGREMFCLTTKIRSVLNLKQRDFTSEQWVMLKALH